MFTVSTDNFDLGWDGCMATLETAGLYTALKRKLKVKGTEMCVLHVLCSFSVAVCFCMCVFFFLHVQIQVPKYVLLSFLCADMSSKCVYVPARVFHSNSNVYVHYVALSTPQFQHACMCVGECVCACVCVCSASSGPPLMCVPHVRVLYTQHYVVVGAGVGVLS